MKIFKVMLLGYDLLPCSLPPLHSWDTGRRIIDPTNNVGKDCKSLLLLPSYLVYVCGLVDDVVVLDFMEAISF